MRFIHSNKQYIERTMYPINPYMNAPAVAPLTMEAFVAPANFDPDAQELNIVKAFAAYPDANKKYIFSVGASATTVLYAVAGRSYAYAENGGAYTTIPSGTVTWTVGSTKRNVVVIDSASEVIGNIPVGGVWGYISDKCNTLSSKSNSYLKYVHAQSLISIKFLELACFFGCIGLDSSLTIPNSVTNTPDGWSGAPGSFENCTGLTSIIIPSSVTYIGARSFKNCAGLISVIIPNSVTYIGGSDYGGAFQSCTGLTSITIPPSVTYIGDHAFAGCSIANFNSNNHLMLTLTFLGAGAFYGCSKILSVDLATSSFSSIRFLQNPLGTFRNCTGLVSVTLPSTLLYIQKQAFINCTSLSNIHSLATTPPLISGYSYGEVFSGVNKTTCILHVPSGSLAAYQAAQYWNEFTNIIDDL